MNILKKEFDLFGFIKECDELFCVGIDGKVNKFDTHYCKHLIEPLKEHYNIFQTEELAEKARTMSLDERKQLLFANANGYEVFNREQAIELYEKGGTCELFFDIESKEWHFYKNNYRLHGEIHFKFEAHAEDCADFMDEKNK